MSSSISHAHATTPLTKAILLALVWLPIFGIISAIVLLWNSYVTWVDVALLLTFFTLCGYGITIGYHRMLTHKSFQAHPWLKTFLLICGSMAMQGPALHWAATHVQHHANSDDDDDPHSPLKSLNTWWLWVFTGLLVPTGIGALAAVFFGKSILIGAFGGLVWGGFVRLFMNQHITWSVNSICHTFGRRSFETTDASRNNFLFGILAMGEGWHNNHHAFPRSARHGMHWTQPDSSAWLIWIFEKLGLVKDVVLISPTRIKARLASQPDPEPESIILPVPAEQRD